MQQKFLLDFIHLNPHLYTLLATPLFVVSLHKKQKYGKSEIAKKIKTLIRE